MHPYFIIDCHCDTIEKYADGTSTLDDPNSSHITLRGLKRGGVGLQFFAAWAGKPGVFAPLRRCLFLIDAYHRLLSETPDLYPVLTFSDIHEAREQNRIGTVLTVEGGEALEGELSHLSLFHQLGVRGITLTWNYRNEIADGALEQRSGGGLSAFGVQVVQEMNRMGMLVDVSHLSEAGFWDVAEISNKPYAATHSNAKGVWDHPRNLSDAQILAIKQAGGFVGINFYPPFLCKKNAGIEDVLRHIEYIAALAGLEVLAFGSDFDGVDTLPQDIKGPEDYTLLIEELLKRNYTEGQIQQIAYRTVLHTLEQVFSESVRNKNGTQTNTVC